jgi:leucyl/phenylalanyl-tRNA---protein transferase
LRVSHGLTLEQVVAAYVRGWFPMDDERSEELPWFAPDRRAVFELDAAALERARRKVRRSLRHAGRFTFATDRSFGDVVHRCAQPRDPGDGVWLTPRMRALYDDLHGAGLAHTFELWEGDTLAAGVVAVTLGGAAMLESMFHAVPHAGNVLLVRTLEYLVASGFELCDIQLASRHTRRLGAHEIAREEYERRLRRALRRNG